MAILDQIGTFFSSPEIRGLAQGLLAASGPSRTPISYGQALGMGMQQAERYRQEANEEDLKKQELGLRKRALDSQIGNQSQSLYLHLREMNQKLAEEQRKNNIRQQLTALVTGQPSPVKDMSGLPGNLSSAAPAVAPTQPAVNDNNPPANIAEPAFPPAASPEPAPISAHMQPNIPPQQQALGLLGHVQFQSNITSPGITPAQKRNKIASLLMATGDTKTALQVAGLLGQEQTALAKNIQSAVDASGYAAGSKEAKDLNKKLWLGSLAKNQQTIRMTPDGGMEVVSGPSTGEVEKRDQTKYLNRELAKVDSQAIKTGRSAIQGANNTLNVIDGVQKLMPALPSAVTGPISSGVFNLDKLNDTAQKINKAVGGVVLQTRQTLGGMPGALSDKDLEFLKSASLSGTSVDKPVLQDQLDRLKKINQKLINYSLFQENYLKAHGSLLGSENEWQNRLSRGEKLEANNINPSKDFWISGKDTTQDDYKIRALKMSEDERQQRINELLAKQNSGGAR